MKHDNIFIGITIFLIIIFYLLFHLFRPNPLLFEVEDLNKIEDCHNLNFKYCDGECKQVFDDEVFVVIFTGWEDKKCGFRVLKVAK